ncbi:porin family protein [Winogradskyella sp. A3E31]|uniref:porin family protein n=1 Tax=Winogradskyella sp. A3E31 TaxID=3349637 RepID=UPI00398A89E9
MKKLVLAIIAIVCLANVNAQDSRWGVKAGFNSTGIKVSGDGASITDNLSGFYVGIYNDFSISEKFDIRPELQFISVSEDGENSSFLALPILAKVNITDKFSLLAGPQLDYLLDEDADDFGLKRLGLGLAAGLEFDITENLMIDGRYSFGINNRIEDEFGGDQVDAKFSFVQVGLGYRF